MNRQHVIAGPYRIAHRYAQAQGWGDDDYLIITRGHQLAKLDPALIASIVIIKLHALGERILDEIHQEIDRVQALWPVRTWIAA